MNTAPLALSVPSGQPTLPRERRVLVRHVVNLEAVSRPQDMANSISWGAMVQDISAGGMSLLICFPFKVGVDLAVDVRGAKRTRTLILRVVHVADLCDGTWSLGGEFVKPLSAEELSDLL